MFKISSLILLLTVHIADAKKTESYFDNAVQLADNVWIGSQPDKNDLQELKASGIDNVISVSTAKELQKPSLDEPSAYADLGIGYKWLELGKRKSFTPQKLAEFHEMMLPNSGKDIIIYSKNFERAKQLVASWMCVYENTKIALALESVESKHELIPQNMMALLGMNN